MRQDIRWEHQKGTGRRRPRLPWKGGWYSCLLLFCGAMACVFSAYRQLCDMYGKIQALALPDGFWGYLALTASALAALYGSGKLKYRWLRLLPALLAGFGFYRYYAAHQLAVEDGSLYLARCYVTEFCRYHKYSIMFPLGVWEQAPGALLFWSLLLLVGLFVLAAAVRKYYLLLTLPLAVLIAGLLTGKAPGWGSVFVLLAAAFVLGAPWTSLPGRWYARTAQLAGVLCICIIAGQIFAVPAGRVVKLHDAAAEKQTALEDALLNLPVWELFEQDGTVSNQAPRTRGREVLSIWLSGEVTENIYLKDYAASHYENGRWSTQERAFSEAAAAWGMTVEEAGEQLLALSGVSGFFGNYKTDAGSSELAAVPWSRGYVINCKGIGTDAPLPYVSELPDGLSVHGDAAADKPWNLKCYSGELMTGVSRENPFLSDLQLFYLHDAMDAWYAGSYYYGTQEQQEGIWDWYGELAKRVYAKSPDFEGLADFTVRKLSEFGVYWSQEEIDDIWDTDSISDLNSRRLIFAEIVQYIMQHFGSYSLTLDPLPEGADPIDYFLTTSEEGYCVHYASAAVLMLQNIGIPARYASGYVVFPNDFKEAEDGGYEAVVTDQRAHAWAEIYLEDFGWVPLEVTPGFASTAAAEDEAEDAGGTKSAAGDSAENENGGIDKEQQREPAGAKESGDDSEESNTNTGKQDKDKDMDIAAADGGILDEELLGLPLRQWLYGFAGVLAAALVVWLMILLCRSYRRRQEELLRRELRSGQYKAAINRMNRRIYRRLCGRHLLGVVRIRDDESYRTALEKQCGAQEADVCKYMKLVNEAYFSGEEMHAEDAETVYGVYLVIRGKHIHRKK